MKPAVFNPLRLTLAVLVLAAAAVDLLLPSPRCGDPGAEAERVSRRANAADACVAWLPTADEGLREP
jgi:hypothetical protein